MNHQFLSEWNVQMDSCTQNKPHYILTLIHTRRPYRIHWIVIVCLKKYYIFCYIQIHTSYVEIIKYLSSKKKNYKRWAKFFFFCLTIFISSSRNFSNVHLLANSNITWIDLFLVHFAINIFLLSFNLINVYSLRYRIYSYTRKYVRTKKHSRGKNKKTKKII